MQIVRFSVGRRILHGLMVAKSVIGLESPFFQRDGLVMSGERWPLDKVKLLAPCQPTKVVAVGLNYKPHAEELKMALPHHPLIFLKPPSAVIGPGEPIIIPPGATRVDYEGELAIVIGKTARHVTAKQAPAFIFGYTCFNDVTERDQQKEDGQWTRAKGYDTFAPLGPGIETDLYPLKLELTTKVNGEVKQSGNTSDCLFDAYQLVSFISGVMTLNPGDVIATGTPSGIGPLKAGDTVEVEIEGIGKLVNKVADYQA
jgi:2-keto-4-pentenoate hydratase/2-oxohepta-3-ene-1,7-dioic acid hydratase in catechol pathway